MAILLIADHDNSALNDTTLKALTAALQQVELGEDGAAGKTSSQVRYVGTGVVVGLGLKVEAPRMAATTRLSSSPYEVVKPSCSLIS